MARFSVRKLFLFGRYSLALLLPKTWLRELEVEAGDQVNLELDRKRRRIIIHLSTSETPKATSSKRSSRSQTDPQPTEEGDWQPIPQL